MLQSADRAINNECERKVFRTFLSAGSTMEWLQIEFPRIVNAIRCVEEAKRHNSYAVFKQVELRVGNSDESGEGAVKLSANPLVGYFDAAVPGEMMAVFDLEEKPASGRFLTLQQAKERLGIDELFIKV